MLGDIEAGKSGARKGYVELAKLPASGNVARFSHSSPLHRYQ